MEISTADTQKKSPVQSLSTPVTSVTHHSPSRNSESKSRLMPDHMIVGRTLFWSAIPCEQLRWHIMAPVQHPAITIAKTHGSFALTKCPVKHCWSHAIVTMFPLLQIDIYINSVRPHQRTERIDDFNPLFTTIMSIYTMYQSGSNTRQQRLYEADYNDTGLMTGLANLFHAIQS